MNRKQTRWHIRQRQIDHLSHTLKPVRTCREVAGILGISVALVCQLETSALSKIVRAVNDFENNEKDENSEIPNHE